ncbi:porphobilinogen deaminase-like protein, partial [Halanaerobium congolense]
MGKNYIIGTRDSNLALKQCNIVKEKLQKKFPEIGFEFKEISTKGDRERDKKFADINAEGIFVREIEMALISREVDLAVHSFKDLPTRLPKDLEIAAIVDRANRYDVLAGA